MSRFEVRRRLLAGLWASWALGLGARRLDAGPARRILVIGAGLAGLSAARALRDAGHVDEFQDISQSRARLVKALKAQHADARIFAVGDDWQSIFRVASGTGGMWTRAS